MDGFRWKVDIILVVIVSMLLSLIILGGGEIALEMDGWVKVALEDEDGYFQHYRPGPSAEQRNWLSLNGYLVED